MERDLALRLSLLSVGLLIACNSASSSTPDGGVEAGSPMCSVELIPTDVYSPVQQCCHTGATVAEADALFADGDLGPVCRGECRIGGTATERVLRCDCGDVEWDGTQYNGPGACGEGEVCCVRGPGGPSPGPTCMKPEECFDCRPSAANSNVIVDCCRGAACRGVCYDDATTCRCGDGPGCEAGEECCGDGTTIACVPDGTCGKGPCPEPPSSVDAVATCCNSSTCRGSCLLEHGANYCECTGENRACSADEECCLGPSRDPAGVDTFCGPKGSCGG